MTQKAWDPKALSDPFFLTKLILFALEGLYSDSSVPQLGGLACLLRASRATGLSSVAALLARFGENLIHAFKRVVTSYDGARRAQTKSFLEAFQNLFRLFEDLNTSSVSFILEEVLRYPPRRPM